ncbi:MAG: serine/threonine-protein kinase [Leptolyngbyaceae cyanobacterium MO_188.B28]|nr:serine/threonine-protein kinase [Leptolyngbyaceae cyanobacterium MO_188.B28]
MSVPDLFLANVLKDRYQLQRRLSKKAGRRTLLAFDQETQQPVILKVLTYSQELDWEKIRLFQREAELLQTLSHPSIPQYIDAFEFETAASKGYTLVQAYIDAPSLEDHLKAGRNFTEDDVRHVLESALEILSYLHTRQPPVIHRDIKPSNILLADSSGNSPGRIYLVDFGSVQTLASRGGKPITVVGTYGFMPPEQFGNVACPASDLYSLGVTAIAILTQTHPADLPTAGLQIQFEDKVSLQPSFQTWLQRMTAPEILDRPESAQAALRLLNSPDLSPIFALKPSPPRTPMTMTPTQLLMDAVWRSIRSGAMFGVICMSAFPGIVMVAHPQMLIVIVSIGAACGVLLGSMNGLLVGILTKLFYFPLNRFRTHCAVCTKTSAVVGFMTGLLGFSTSVNNLYLSNDYLFTFKVTMLLPAILLIGGMMGIASHNVVSHWYQRPSVSLPDHLGKL